MFCFVAAWKCESEIVVGYMLAETEKKGWRGDAGTDFDVGREQVEMREVFDQIGKRSPIG